MRTLLRILIAFTAGLKETAAWINTITKNTNTEE